MNYYSCFTITDDFCLNKTSEDKVLKIITKIEISKAAGIDRLSRLFLRDVAEILSRSISEICYLSISRGFFSDTCKTNTCLQKYEKRQTLPTTDLFLYFQPFMR